MGRKREGVRWGEGRGGGGRRKGWLGRKREGVRWGEGRGEGRKTEGVVGEKEGRGEVG